MSNPVIANKPTTGTVPTAKPGADSSKHNSHTPAVAPKAGGHSEHAVTPPVPTELPKPNAPAKPMVPVAVKNDGKHPKEAHLGKDRPGQAAMDSPAKLAK